MKRQKFHCCSRQNFWCPKYYVCSEEAAVFQKAQDFKNIAAGRNGNCYLVVLKLFIVCDSFKPAAILIGCNVQHH